MEYWAVMTPCFFHKPFLLGAQFFFSKFHKELNASNLPKVCLSEDHDDAKVTVEDDQQESDESYTNIMCDRCEGQKAICYCVDCGDKICSSHLEVG